MFRNVFFASTTVGLIACGGSSLNSVAPDPVPSPAADSSAYVDYMKSAYSEYLGDEYSEEKTLNLDNFAEIDLVATPVAEAQADNYQGYSETNVQIAGVDEADSLKFDGQNLLWLGRDTAGDYFADTIVRSYNQSVLAGDNEADNALHFLPAAEYQYQGLLSYDERAALVGSSNYWYGWDIWMGFDIAFTEPCFNCSPGENDIVIYTWPYAQDGVPLIPEVDTIKIDGSLIETRLINNKLYVISQFSPEVAYAHSYPQNADERAENQVVIDALSVADLVPKITFDSGDALLFDASECRIAEQDASEYSLPNVISITEIDINSPSEWQSSCYVGNTNRAFVSQDNIYLSRAKWFENEVEIVKYALTDDGPEYRAMGTVSGSQSYDSYYFGEIDGKLAYVNTVYDNQNWWEDDGRHQLSVFDEIGESLELVAQIPNEDAPAPIGKPGEQIYAVRFMGERAYVVTFDKVDPLYVIDLSTPEQPEILGELEIPGFSSYLHVISDDLILGVGKNAVEENGTTWFQGLNIRLFDVSDPSQPIAIESHDYGLRGSHTAVLGDPHAFTFIHETESNRFRFTLPMQLHGGDGDIDTSLPANTYYPWQETSLVQFEIDTSGVPSLEEVGRFGLGEQYSFNQTRSVINADKIYVANEDELHVVEWRGSESLRGFPEN